jgi:hypothetical protein
MEGELRLHLEQGEDRGEGVPPRDAEPVHTNLIAEIGKIFDARLATFKHELILEHEDISSKLEKRLKTTDYTYKKRGNKEQHDVNKQVLDSITETKHQLTRDRPSLDRALEALDQGMSVLVHRNKMVQFADSNPSGWAAVDEYERKVLASDSDDDKKMRKAESMACRKLKDKKVFSHKRGRGGRPASTQSRPSGGYGSVFGAGYGGGYGTSTEQPFRFPAGQFSGRGRSAGGKEQGCWGCGDLSHQRRNCRKVNGRGGPPNY